MQSFFDYPYLQQNSSIQDVIRTFNDLIRKLLEKDKQIISPYQVNGKVTNFNSSSGSTYNIERDDGLVVINTSSQTVHVYLRDANENNNNKSRIVCIKKSSASNSLIIHAVSGQTIDGSATITLSSLNESKRLMSDGYNWWII